MIEQRDVLACLRVCDERVRKAPRVELKFHVARVRGQPQMLISVGSSPMKLRYLRLESRRHVHCYIMRVSMYSNGNLRHGETQGQSC